MTLDLSLLLHKPWTKLAPDIVQEINLPKGLIEEEERCCFHYLAKHCLSGQGQIVDAGAYIGASAYCFASGLAQSPHRDTTRIHSYDRFEVYADYETIRIGEYRPAKGGDGFFDIFQFQTGRYKDLIIPHKGDFLEQRWNHGPIDILFIDLAKTSDLHTHIVEQFYTHLVPGKSLLIHQDFFNHWTPWIHYTMEFLKHRFEIIDRFIYQSSRLFLLKDAIRADEIVAIANFSKQQKLDLLDACIPGEKGDCRTMARLSKLCQHGMDNDLNGYQDERHRLISELGEGRWQEGLRLLDNNFFAAIRYE